MHGPALQGHDHRFLDCVLCQTNVTSEADEGGQDTATLHSQQFLQRLTLTAHRIGSASVGEIDHRADFHPSVPGARDLRSPGDGFVEILAVE